jgi:TolB-like protein
MKRPIPEESKLECLEKVLDSATFARAEQLRGLLRWLGQRAIEGGPTPTEHEVGKHALRRSENFDPHTDSLVRKEMSRLRAKLRDYSNREGSADAVRIRSDAGYRLTFEWASATAQPRPASGGPLCILVLPLRISAVPEDAVNAFYDELFSRISRANRVQLVSQTTARRYAGRYDDVRQYAEETGADAVIEGSARADGTTFIFTLSWVDGRSGRIKQIVRLAGTNIEALAQETANAVAAEFGPEEKTFSADAT